MRLRTVLTATTILCCGVAIVVPVLSAKLRGVYDDTAVCLERTADIAEAILLYAADNGDRMPLVIHNLAPNQFDLNRGNTFWGEAIAPYNSDWYAHRCPASTYSTDEFLLEWLDRYPPATTPGAQAEYQAFFSNRGYNWLYMCPVSQTAIYPIALSQVGGPANTLLVVDSIALRTASGKPAGAGILFVDPPCRYEVGDPPKDTFPVPPGTQLYSNTGWRPTQPASSLLYGGAWPWHRAASGSPREQRFIAGFVDGHSAALSVSQLTAGCDVRDNWLGFIFDRQAYLWDLE
jgi:hypothetical protein